MKDKIIKMSIIEVLLEEYKEMLDKKDYSFVSKDTLLNEIARLDKLIKYSDDFLESEDVKQIESKEDEH